MKRKIGAPKGQKNDYVPYKSDPWGGRENSVPPQKWAEKGVSQKGALLSVT